MTFIKIDGNSTSFVAAVYMVTVLKAAEQGRL